MTQRAFQNELTKTIINRRLTLLRREDRIAEYEAPYGGAEGEAARAALEKTCTANDYKGLMAQVTKVRGRWWW